MLQEHQPHKWFIISNDSAQIKSTQDNVEKVVPPDMTNTSDAKSSKSCTPSKPKARIM